MPRYFVILALFFLLTLSKTTSAHAFLDHADPKVGSTVAGSPQRVTLYFTQELELAFSTVKVFDAAGAQIDSQDVKLDAANPSVMTVSVPKLSAGTYKVEWHVTSVDTHKTHGSFVFTVQPKG